MPTTLTSREDRIVALVLKPDVLQIEPSPCLHQLLQDAKEHICVEAALVRFI